MRLSVNIFIYVTNKSAGDTADFVLISMHFLILLLAQ